MSTCRKNDDQQYCNREDFNNASVFFIMAMIRIISNRYGCLQALPFSRPGPGSRSGLTAYVLP